MSNKKANAKSYLTSRNILSTLVRKCTLHVQNHEYIHCSQRRESAQFFRYFVTIMAAVAKNLVMDYLIAFSQS